jgi:hypothetical protein
VAAGLHPAVGALAAAGEQWFRGMAGAMAARAAPPALDDLDAALRTYREAVAKLREAGILRGLEAEPLSRIFALGFALEELREDAGDLAGRAVELARAGSK